MRKFVRWLLLKPVLFISEKYSSRPNKERVHSALSQLYTAICKGNSKKGQLINFDVSQQKFIIFSDQHKGGKDGSDDFAIAEKNYLTALDYYYQQNFHFISLGDNEELWENTISTIKKYNAESFEKEKLFLQRNAFIKVFGNHDLYWDSDPFASFELQNIFGQKVSIYEGVILRALIDEHPLDIFLTHGHQGDELSDGNWFSKWFIAKIWAPLQSYLLLNPNTPAYEDHLKTDHNRLMYEWVAPKENLLLITGHTHQPIFQSLTLLERLYQKLAAAKSTNDMENIRSIEDEITRKKIKGEKLPDFTGYQPSYFNSGCCCFNDGDITGIEIADGKMKLIKWEYGTDKKSTSARVVLEEAPLFKLKAKV